MIAVVDRYRSERRCPRCHKALEAELGADDDGRRPSTRYTCLGCGYWEESTPSWTREDIRRRVETVLRQVDR